MSVTLVEDLVPVILDLDDYRTSYTITRFSCLVTTSSQTPLQTSNYHLHEPMPLSRTDIAISRGFAMYGQRGQSMAGGVSPVF
jgi:hypothetical protein